MRIDSRWALLTLCLPLLAAKADNPTDYAYAYELQIGDRARADAYRIELPPQVLAAANPDAELRDIVVLDAADKPVPFGPLPPAPPKKQAFETNAHLLPVPATKGSGDTVKVERNADGRIIVTQDGRDATSTRSTTWLIDAGRTISLDNLQLDPATLQQDFQIQVDLDSSDDLRQWRHLGVDENLIRVRGASSQSPASAADTQVQQLSIDLNAAAPARYYLLRLTDGKVDWNAEHAPSVKLTGSYTDPIADRAASLQWLEVVNTGGDTSDYDYELPAALPVAAVRLTLPATNNAARVHLQVPQSNDPSTRTDIGTLDLVRTAGQGGAATASWNNPITLHHLRLHSDTPLSGPPQVNIGWIPPQMVFLPEGQGPYRLLVGSYAARRGDYPIGEALERLRDTNAPDWSPPTATLGPRADAGGAQALAAPKVPFDWTKPLLWAVLVVGALAVGGMALSLLKQNRPAG